MGDLARLQLVMGPPFQRDTLDLLRTLTARLNGECCLACKSQHLP